MGYRWKCALRKLEADAIWASWRLKAQSWKVHYIRDDDKYLYKSILTKLYLFNAMQDEDIAAEADSGQTGMIGYDIQNAGTLLFFLRHNYLSIIHSSAVVKSEKTL